MIKNSTRHNRLADGSPVPDVEVSDEIRLALKATGNAPEKGSLRPVFPVNGMVFRAFPAGVMGIDLTLTASWMPGELVCERAI